jgi:hypothetical protein
MKDNVAKRNQTSGSGNIICSSFFFQRNNGEVVKREFEHKSFTGILLISLTLPAAMSFYFLIYLQREVESQGNCNKKIPGFEVHNSLYENIPARILKRLVTGGLIMFS